MSTGLTPIRLSHLLSHSGVGAIVRGPNGLMVVQDIRHWTDRQHDAAGEIIPYVERVRSALEIGQTLRTPPFATILENGYQNGVCIPATRFPSWVHCPACKTLSRWPWKRDGPDEAPRCTQNGCTTRPFLEQVVWVLVSKEGYLADVPWHFLAHQKADVGKAQKCKIKDQLRLIEGDSGKRVVHCDSCNEENEFRGDEHLPFGLGRMQPWTRDELVPVGENRALEAQVLTVNDARTYSPVAKSALVIPPESRVRKGTVVDRIYRQSEGRRRIDKAHNKLARKGLVNRLAGEFRCSANDIELALEDIRNGYPLYEDGLTAGQLSESEFNAFLEVLPDQRDDEDFVTRNRSSEWHGLGQVGGVDGTLNAAVNGIAHLIQVDRLKAVKVFMGFSRLNGTVVVPPDIVGQSDWLPAIELYGEGIFLALDEVRLEKWERLPSVRSRLGALLPRFARSSRDTPNPLSARFMLLHSLSHLLMRQIESEGGYPASSLQERIYCSQSPVTMAGILIHVAVPDIAGSLGGLAELSEPKRFLGILTRALERSRWCSLDPVCSEHEGQGPGLLNRAACHACALVPEPACDYGNELLDRGFVKGDPANGMPSYFEDPLQW